tara:strand:- start:20 stop:916 length:897 start_codon:yes stop_codon:yes gene_type:complete
MKKNINCPLCEKDDHSIFLKKKFEELDPIKLYGAANGIKNTQDLVKCNNCDLIYENPRLDEELIIHGYTHSNEDGHDTQYDLRVKSFYNALLKIKKKLPKNPMILDVGSAGGAFIEAAKMHGFDNVEGIEPSKQLYEKSISRNHKIFNGDLKEFIKINDTKKFDLVCYWDVIEHLAYPKKELELSKKILNNNGLLLINFPDIGTFQAKLFGKNFWWIISVHLVHFTKVTMKSLLEKVGFDTIHVSRYWQYLELGYLIEMAIKLNFVGARFLNKLIPKFLKKLPLPYYASQTTVLGKLK